VNESRSSSHSTILDPKVSWWLDPALAKLAFGSRPRRNAPGAPSHLAFLPPENLEIDLGDPQQRRFGDYELLELIGQGGMGVVYRARQHSLDREVAVKLLSAGPWASTDFISRFQREAQSAAKMQHPNIVAIHEIGAHEELNFFSMRLVEGGSLAGLIASRGKLAPREAARLLRPVAEAVDYAHRLDVLHLDLKPGNVLLDDNGDPLVADFGLAKRLDDTLAADSSEVSGTPSYMAPEQAQLGAQSLTPATDIYGLGAVLYECLTGRPPFAAKSAQQTLHQVVTEAPVPLRQIDDSIPPDLEAICLKCLHKEPGKRYATARALADDLNRYLEGREVRARPLNSGQRLLLYARRQPRLTAMVALLLFSLMGGFAASWLQWQRAETNASSAKALLWEGRREAALQLEREGKGFEALPKLLANIGEQQLAGRSADVAMEQRRIEMLVAQGATLIDRTVIADANPLATEVSPDGSLVAVAMNDQTVRWYDAGTLVERGRVNLAARGTSDGERRSVLLLRFVDSHRLLATFEWYANMVSPSESDSWLIDLDAARVVEPPPAFADFADASYSANGRYAMLRNHQRQSQLWQLDPWRPLSGFSAAEGDYLPWFIDPQGHYVGYLSVAMRKLRLFDSDDLASPRLVEMPTTAGISALAMDSNGDEIALGDFEGRLFLLNTRSGGLRTLPVARGSEISWLSFSEDGAWFASGSHDGSVHVFDVASGDSLTAGQMDHDFAVQRIGLSRAQRLLVVAGEGRTSLWRVPIPGPRAVPAQRIGMAPAPHGLTGRYPIGWSLGRGLLATAGIDGQLRLWRLPTAPSLPALAAAQIPERTWYQPGHVVDVAWNRVRISTPAGVSLGPWLQLPQPPGFAELLDRGRLLVLSVGPELRFYQAPGLQPRFRPIPLPASPERLLANADGSRVVLAFGDRGKDGFGERLMVFDGQSGRRLAGEVVLPGQLRRLALSHDSSRMLAVGVADAETTVLSVSGLRTLGAYPHDPFEPVIWADFSATGKDVLLVTRAQDSRLGSDKLVRWDPESDHASSTELPAQTGPLGVSDTGAGVFVSGQAHDLLLSKAGKALTLPRLARSSPVAETALSPGGKLLARAFQREVQLIDLASGATIGPPLLGDGNAIDVIAQVAFAPDGASVLARTVQGHWLLWPIAAAKGAAHLTESLPALHAEREQQNVVRMPDAQVRAELRGDDPGVWQALAAQPPLATVAGVAGIRVPARAAGTPQELLDLSSLYNFGPEEVRNRYYNIRPTMRPLPMGRHRLGGQDFEIRGMAQIGIADYTRDHEALNGVKCLALPARPIAALRPLLTISARRPMPTGELVGVFTLRFVDGSSARLPIRAGREVRGFSGDDATVPVAFAGDRVLALFGLQDDVLVAPRLANPYPERTPRCLDIDAQDTTLPMLLLALTLEPPAPGLP
jgi:WD40 repeat protein